MLQKNRCFAACIITKLEILFRLKCKEKKRALLNKCVLCELGRRVAGGINHYAILRPRGEAGSAQSGRWAPYFTQVFKERQTLWKQDIYITHPDNLLSRAHISGIPGHKRPQKQAGPTGFSFRQGQSQINYFKVHFKSIMSITTEIIYKDGKKIILYKCIYCKFKL